ncbi:hypothetical protein Elgi_56110 [Paenibacillus elgii]|uniref:hypothetical protein n=1 Tax=Paenibacillus elgii TaxID=189691 RepID=UPI002D7C86E4|nr:hypothetical protein Elgi_56110 [Paenibacillus elgii]
MIKKIGLLTLIISLFLSLGAVSAQSSNIAVNSESEKVFETKLYRVTDPSNPNSLGGVEVGGTASLECKNMGSKTASCDWRITMTDKKAKIINVDTFLMWQDGVKTVFRYGTYGVPTSVGNQEDHTFKYAGEYSVIFGGSVGTTKGVYTTAPPITKYVTVTE